MSLGQFSRDFAENVAGRPRRSGQSNAPAPPHRASGCADDLRRRRPSSPSTRKYPCRLCVPATETRSRCLHSKSFPACSPDLAAGQNLSPIDFVEIFQAAGHVHGVAQDGIGETFRRADIPNKNFAAVQSHSRAKRNRLSSLPQCDFLSPISVARQARFSWCGRFSGALKKQSKPSPMNLSMVPECWRNRRERISKYLASSWTRTSGVTCSL